MPCRAQVDSLVNVSYKKRLQLLAPFYGNDVVARDSIWVVRYIDAVEVAAKKAGDEGLITEAYLMRGYFYLGQVRDKRQEAEDYFKQIRQRVTKKNDLCALARLENLEGEWFYSVNQNYELAFSHWYNALDVYRRMPEPLLDIRFPLIRVSSAHFDFADYGEAIPLIREALSVSNMGPSVFLLEQGNNNLGLCYQRLHKLDSSDYYFRCTYAAADSLNDENWRSIASGNLGNNLFMRGKYEEAIPLLQRDVKASVERGDWPCASGSQTILADIMVRQNNIPQATVEVAKARQYVYRSRQYGRLKPLYPILCKFYAATGDAKLSTLYLDSSIFVNDSLARQYSALQLLKARQKIDLEKSNALIADIQSQKKIKIIERNVVIAFVVILLVAAIYVYRNQRKKHQQRQGQLNMQLKEKDAELALARNQIDGFATNISEKNKLLETLQQQFTGNANNDAIVQLQQSTILTDAEWEKFRAAFEKVHGGYLNRLKEKLPGLSPSETRYMVLAKLHLSNKEMAAALGIGQHAIRVTTHRLRKKLNMTEEGGLDELVNSI